MSSIPPAILVRDGFTGDKTILVLGAWRGGTSMLAEVLIELGIFMGEKESFGWANAERTKSNFEDSDFDKILFNPFLYEYLKTGNEPSPAEFDAKLPELERLVMSRNQRGTWGWKHPSTALWCVRSMLLMRLRYPHIISIWRDPIAIWQHEMLPECHEDWLQKDIAKASSDGKSLAPDRSLAYVARQTRLLEESLLLRQYPQLVISYERCVCGGARSAVNSIIEFLKLNPCPEAIDAAIRVIIKRNGT
ncbi:MAG: Lipopolysaccharide biosynthesis protein [Planctomycetaceae bacterium]|nr:Lipopolysaccharide biosynthesis protein [Planctomycetaceae bacterium]